VSLGADSSRIIAVRHGETAWNVDTRIQGQLDIALNERGRWQVGRLGVALREEPVSAIYTSDLWRAYDTSLSIAQPKGMQVIVDKGLRERGFGTFEGKTFAEIEAHWPEQARRWRQRDPEFAPEGGESLLQFRQRVTDTAHRLAASHRGEQIVLVAHGGVMDVLYRAATGQELQAPRTWELGNAAINRLLWSEQGFTLIGWADTRHLEDESLDETTA
jgi:probable phosphoglycerate mutase